MTLTEKINKARFGWAVRSLLATPPLVRGDTGYTVLSMVQHRDVLPYLLALKSLARFLLPAEVVLVADPTLDVADRALLREHVPHIQVRDAREFHAAGRVQGGTWERLWAISEYAQKGYVVQLDADTVTLRRPAEVASAIADGVSFTLGTDDGQQIQPTSRGRRVGSRPPRRRRPCAGAWPRLLSTTSIRTDAGATCAAARASPASPMAASTATG